MSNLTDEYGRTVTVSRRAVKYIELKKTAALNAGVNEYDAFIVPAGKAWFLQVYGRQVDAPPGATSGTHGWTVYVVSPGGMTDYGRMEKYDISISYNVNITAGYNDASKLIAGPGATVYIEYRNNTNAAQTNTRKVVMCYIEEDV